MNVTDIPGGTRAVNMRRIITVADQAAIASRAAELLYETTKTEAENISIALAGGNTPKLLYRMLAAAPWIEMLPWQRINWYFGDERFVPASDPQSNFRMSKENLLDPAQIRLERIFRVKTELSDARQAAEDYENTIRLTVAMDENKVPVFDLILLGMGDDGHTASLFPQTAALSEDSLAVVENYVDKLSAWRITVTKPVLLAAKQVIVMVSGSEKASALAAVLEGAILEDTYPSQVLNRRTLPTTWIVDQSAASQLSGLGT